MAAAAAKFAAVPMPIEARNRLRVTAANEGKKCRFTIL